MRVALVSDIRLSARSPECAANWHAARRAIERLHVDLTVHLGEVTLGGLFCADEFRLAAHLIGQWPTAMRCLTGNSDFADASWQTGLPAQWLRACRPSFGTDHWVLRAGGWRLLGLNAQILGTGSVREQALWRLVELESMHSSAPEQTAIFAHWPNACGLASSGDKGARHAAGAAYARLIDGPLKHSLSLVVASRMPAWIDVAATGVSHVWLPSKADSMSGHMQHRIGQKLVGVGLLELGREQAGFDMWCPDGITRHQATMMPLGRAIYGPGSHEQVRERSI